MGRRKPTARSEFVLFNVIYEDGTVTSNRKVPSSMLGGLAGEAPARHFIEAQDRDRRTFGAGAGTDQVRRSSRPVALLWRSAACAALRI